MIEARPEAAQTAPPIPSSERQKRSSPLGLSFIVMVTQVKIDIFNMLYSQELRGLLKSTGYMYCGGWTVVPYKD